MRRSGVVAAVLVALLGGCRDEPTRVARTTPKPAKSLLAPASEFRAPRSASASPELTTLDAMLDEINTKWKKNQDVIHTPKSVAPFEVVDDGGVQVLVARAELSMQDVVEHLRKRSAGIQNPGLKQYTDGSLVTLGADGTKSSIEPTVLALNETLIIFVVPNRGDTNLVNRVEVALP